MLFRSLIGLAITHQPAAVEDLRRVAVLPPGELRRLKVAVRRDDARGDPRRQRGVPAQWPAGRNSLGLRQQPGLLAVAADRRQHQRSGQHADAADVQCHPDRERLLLHHRFAAELHGTPAATSEIKELIWFGPDDDPAQLAPSLRDLIFPDLLARRLLWV